MFMAEMVLQARTLPEPIFRLIRSEKVKVRKHKGEVHLIPINDEASASDCPLLGLYADGKLTIAKHLAWSREDKALEEL